MPTDSEIRYADIINMEYHGSQRPDRMTLEQRAAQFAPFAALPLSQEQPPSHSPSE